MIDLLLTLLQAFAVGALALVPGLAFRVCMPAWFLGRTCMSPLLGYCCLAWWVQLVYMFGFSASAASASAGVLITAILCLRIQKFAEAIKGHREFVLEYAMYFVCCLLATAVLSWPAAGPWGNDWSLTNSQADTIWKLEPLSVGQLARPTLFASMAVPLFSFVTPLHAFQLSVCAVTALALLAVKWMVDRVAQQPTSYAIFFLVICLSPFFLVNLTSFVPKFIQATLIACAFATIWEERGRNLVGRALLSTAMFCFAVELHHSTIAYSVAFIICWTVREAKQPFRLLAGGLLGFALALILVGVPEYRKIALYGLETIVNSNPSKSMRSSEPGWFVLLMTLECMFLGYQFLIPPYIFAKELYLGTSRSLIDYGTWSWFVYLAIASNTFVFIALPLTFTVKRLKSFLGYLRGMVSISVAIGVATVLLIAGVLNPYYISNGNVHCGATALALALLILGLAWLSKLPELAGRSAWWTLLTGGLPFFFWQILQSILIRSRGGFRLSGDGLDDSLDLVELLKINQENWGYSQWPWLPILLLGMAVGLWSVIARRSSICNQTGNGPFYSGMLRP